VHTLAIAIAKPIAHSLAIIGALWWECTAPASVGARARFALQGRIFHRPHTGKKATHIHRNCALYFLGSFFLWIRALGKQVSVGLKMQRATKGTHIIEKREREGVVGERGCMPFAFVLNTYREGFIYIMLLSVCRLTSDAVFWVDLGRCLPFPDGDLINIQWTANNVVMEYFSAYCQLPGGVESCAQMNK